MEQVSVNKWVRFALSAVLFGLGAIITFALQYDWSSIVGPEKAGIAVAVISVVKMAYECFAPSSDKTVKPTGGTIITHRAVESPPRPPIAS